MARAETREEAEEMIHGERKKCMHDPSTQHDSHRLLGVGSFGPADILHDLDFVSEVKNFGERKSR